MVTVKRLPALHQSVDFIFDPFGVIFSIVDFSVAISVSPHVYLSFNSDFFVSKIMHL